MTTIHEFTGVEAVEIRTDIANMWHAGRIGDDVYAGCAWIFIMENLKVSFGWLEDAVFAVDSL